MNFNLSDYIKPAMHEMVAKKEREIGGAIDDVLGAGNWAIADMARRCQLVRVHGSTVETLYLDGKPILEIHKPIFHEPVLEGGRYISRITQNFRRLAQRTGAPNE